MKQAPSDDYSGTGGPDVARARGTERDLVHHLQRRRCRAPRGRGEPAAARPFRFSSGTGGTSRGMNLLRGVPGHPSHPPLTDATIGAYTFATIAAILSKLGVAEHPFAQAWWLALVVGAAASLLTVFTG